MAFRPNYRQQRSERDRSARSRQEEKLQKLQERAAKRKAEREGLEPQPEGEQDPAEKTTPDA